MQGFGNHDHFLGHPEVHLVGAGVLSPGFRMLSFGSFPGVFRDPSAKTGVPRVLGELYRVSDYVLARLDRLEGHPNFYCRERCGVLPAEQELGDYPNVAWVYLIPHPGDLEKAEIVPTNSWWSHVYQMRSEQ